MATLEETADTTNKDSDMMRPKSNKRRSDFSRGRRSLTQLTRDNPGSLLSSGDELYKQVSTDLPPAQRLSIFSRLAVRHTLNVLEAEFEDKPGFSCFKMEALEHMGAAIDSMEKDGTFEQACTVSCRAPNPMNIQRVGRIAELKESIDRLQQEECDWDNLVKSLQHKAQQAEEQNKQLECPCETLSSEVKEMASAFLPPSSELPDLSAMGLQVSKEIKTISLLMDEYCHSVNMLGDVTASASRYMDVRTKTLDHAGGYKEFDLKAQIEKLLGS